LSTIKEILLSALPVFQRYISSDHHYARAAVLHLRAPTDLIIYVVIVSPQNQSSLLPEQ
jgi:hypothetical protein